MTKKSIQKEIRKTTKIEGDCYICDEALTENHHIIKVSTLTSLVIRFNAAIDKLIMPVVTLCPNHHAKWHILADDTTGHCYINDYEKEKYKEIINMAEYEEDDVSYADSYNNSVDEMKALVEKSLEEL
jgi:hypothetical protein